MWYNVGMNKVRKILTSARQLYDNIFFPCEKITSKLLRKIELYCILNNLNLNNASDLSKIPYDCLTCNHLDRNRFNQSQDAELGCKIHQFSNTFKFNSNIHLREFKKEWPKDEDEKKGNRIIFIGCERWEKKE